VSRSASRRDGRESPPHFQNKVTEATQGRAAKLYSQLQSERDPFLRRARDCAKLTIPTLLVEQGHGSHTQIATPFQSLGARGVNNLSSKLLLTLLPPNAPFFRLAIDDFALTQLAGTDQVRGEVEASLLKIEKAVMTEVETSAMRVRVFEALKHLIVCGNVLVYLPKDGGMRTFHLDQYVVQRDPQGNVTIIATKETVAPSTLPPAVLALIPKEEYESPADASKEKAVDIYTLIELQLDGKFSVMQEVCGKEIPSTSGTFVADDLPYIALRMTHISGEDYGRSFVEEYLGDLISLEGLTQAIVEGSAAAARILVLVKPNGTTRLEDVYGAPNGAVKPGNSEDVTFLQAEKQADLRVASETAKEIELRLAQAFLLRAGVQRNAERVTAEEIRYVAQELEDALGGVYSILSVELQLPLVTRLLNRLTKSKRVPKLPKTVRPQIVTGLEALGRGHELNQLDTFGRTGQAILGPEAFAQAINSGDFLTRIANAIGLNTKGLVKSPEQIAQEQQAAQAAAMAQAALPKGMDIAASAMQAQQKQ
jgi:hypothetical protein